MCLESKHHVGRCVWKIDIDIGNKMFLGERVHNQSTATLTVFHVLFLVWEINSNVNYVMSFTQIGFAVIESSMM